MITKGKQIFFAIDAVTVAPSFFSIGSNFKKQPVAICQLVYFILGPGFLIFVSVMITYRFYFIIYIISHHLRWLIGLYRTFPDAKYD